MATDVKREHRHILTENAQQKRPAARPAQRRKSRWLLAVLILLAVVVWLLPIIAVHTPLVGWALHTATAQLNGSVAVESVSLGWFSPVVVRGVEVKDAGGKPVLSVPAASGDRTLAALVCNYANLGRFRLDSPKLALVLRDDGSNLEDLLAKYLAPSVSTKAEPAKPSAKVGLALDIVDASLFVTDQRTGQSWQVQKLAASVEMPDGATGPLAVKLSADLPDAQQSGKLLAGVNMAAGAGQATLSVAGWPLAMFRAPAARFAPGTTCDGRLSSTVTASWGGQAGAKKGIHADLSTEALSLATPALQTDVLRLDRLHAVCQVSWQDDRVEIEQSSVDCDAGYASMSSTLRWDVAQPPSAVQMRPGQPGAAVPRTGLNWLLHQRHDVNGRLDLARLAKLLPATLRLRQKMEVNSGQVQLAVGSRPEQQGAIWHGQLSADNLTATASGKKIAWQQPLSFVLDAHETPAGPVVDALRCDSDFLKIHASGTPDVLAASLTLNLKQLSDQLGQFVDLGTVQLAGEGWGNLNWKRSPQQLFDADADLQLHNFQVTLPGQPPWREDDLVAAFSAKGQTNLGPQTRIDTATLSVKSGSDQLDVRLAQPVKDLRGAWPLHAQAQGQLQNWPGRLAAWVPMKNCRLTGAYNLAADATAATAGVELRQATLTVTPLVVASPVLNVNEPEVRLNARGDYNSQTGVVQLAQFQLASSVLAAGAAGSITPTAGVKNAEFKAQFDYDMDRLVGLLRPYLGSGVRMAGRGSSVASYRGPFSLASGQAAANLKWDGANVYGLQIGPGELKATLTKGFLQIEPLDLSVCQGQMHLAPCVRLTPSPVEILLPKGPLASHIQIDPVLCSTMLKFIAPVLSDVATAQGAFSIDLEGGHIPLGDLASADVVGRFTIHSVEIGSGSLTHELATFLGRDTPAKLKQESVVLFRLSGGRMYHDGLELMFPNFTIRTHGSVGLDQTMAVMAEMPVPPQWLEKNPLISKALRDQVIRVPINGTLSKPELDKKVMQDLTRQFMQKAAENILQEGVGKQLDRLFGPKK